MEAYKWCKAGLLVLTKRENMTCKKDQIDGNKIVETLGGSGLCLQVLLQKIPTWNSCSQATDNPFSWHGLF